MHGRGVVYDGGTCVAGGVHGEGVYVAGVCVCGREAWMVRGMDGGGHVWWGACMVGGIVAGETTTAADGTHPTGMHSCFNRRLHGNFGIICTGS